MGIPSYFSYIVRNHRNIMVQYKSNKITIHNLYMDCNSIIYDVIYELEKNNKSLSNDSYIIKLVCDKIKSYIHLIKPKNNVYIAFDGVAPFAKMNQQKTRRYKTYYENNLAKKLGINKVKLFDTTSITPGTEFMRKLSIEINNEFKNPIKFKLKKLLVSTSEHKGEGEHKIYQYIRDNVEEHTDTTTVIYGLDADLIMLTLNHLYISKSMYLFRETPYFIKSIDNTLNPNDNYLLNIPEFAKVLSCELNDNKPTSNNDYNRVFDYIFLCFFLGNDFLPHFPSLNIRTTGIDRLLDVYKKVLSATKSNLIKNDKIKWNILRKIILELSKNEEQLLIEEYKLRDKQSNSVKKRKLEKDEKLQSIPLLDRSVEEYINPYENGWRERYYQKLFNINIDDDRCKQICINYLEGLEWTFKYYREECKDWKWTYKYNYPPLLCDLVRYMPSFDTEFITEVNDSVEPLTQLSYVLPKSSLYLLPKNIEQQLLDKFKNEYDSDISIDWAFCRYLWEAHINAGNINIEDIENIVNNTTNTAIK